jgi:hypothetical protein
MRTFVLPLVVVLAGCVPNPGDPTVCKRQQQAIEGIELCLASPGCAAPPYDAVNLLRMRAEQEKYCTR